MSTFAARPVGASSIGLIPNSLSAATKAAIIVVLPVPA